MQSNTNPIIDAADTLSAAQQILGYILSNRTREHDAGECWCLGAVEDRIREAINLQDTARQAQKEAPCLKKPQTTC